jgi:hypothetical protein
MFNDPTDRAMTDQAWTVRAAKAKLSEVLRLAREEGPQRIGDRETCIVITEREWQRLSAPKPHLGAWLLANMPETAGLELPDRQDRERTAPFDEPGA